MGGVKPLLEILDVLPLETKSYRLDALACVLRLLNTCKNLQERFSRLQSN
jgi:hypothetical protein